MGVAADSQASKRTQTIAGGMTKVLEGAVIRPEKTGGA